MLSLTRRQVIIGAIAAPFVPALSFAAARAEKLVLSGRVLGANGQPLAGAVLPVGKQSVTTDADGRFLLVTDTAACPAPDARRDANGTWRATCAIVLG